MCLCMYQVLLDFQERWICDAASKITILKRQVEKAVHVCWIFVASISIALRCCEVTMGLIKSIHLSKRDIEEATIVLKSLILLFSVSWRWAIWRFNSEMRISEKAWRAQPRALRFFNEWKFASKESSILSNWSESRGNFFIKFAKFTIRIPHGSCECHFVVHEIVTLILKRFNNLCGRSGRKCKAT